MAKRPSTPSELRDAVERTVQATLGSAERQRERTQGALDDLAGTVDQLRRGAGAGLAKGRRAIEERRPATSEDISELKAELFRALAHPGRIRILEKLVDGERSVGELQPLVGLELSHLSQQLGVLRRADLVTARKDGAQVFYSVRDPNLGKLLATAKQLLIRSLTERQRLLGDLHGGAS